MTSAIKSNTYQGSEQTSTMNGYNEHIQNVIHMQELLTEKSKSFISELSSDIVIKLMGSIVEYNLKLNETQRTASRIQEEVKNSSSTTKNDSLEKEVEQLKNDIENLELQLDEIRHAASQQSLPEDEQTSSSSSPPQNDEKKPNGNIDEDEMIVFLDANTASKISHKVRFSNNIVRFLRGPFKTVVHGTMQAVDICAQGTNISSSILEAVKKGAERRKQAGIDKNDFFQSAFNEITPDWKVEGENPDRGYSSPSIWIHDPQGQRHLIKIQEHPLCAANEWLAYVLGKVVGLPINEVQIAVYQNSLVTIHADVEDENEKTITFMDLPKDKRDALMTHPIMESMDIFDYIIQNVDRNQQNILITIPKTVDINDENLNQVKIHLIDHASSFGMGKLNAISLIAAKFHSNHLAVVKFDPERQSQQFENYLNKLPIKDRPLISKTLTRFASISNEQFDNWITEIEDLLTTSQYNRIHSVLHRQRDIAKNCLIQWNISS